jgi:hypothetical protein
MTHPPPIDLVAVGEILIDLISVERADSLREASAFRRYLGGSPANIAINVSRLGHSAAIVGKIGCGPFGQFLKAGLERSGVNTDYVVMDPQAHTSIVFVSKTSGTPDFQPRRRLQAHAGRHPGGGDRRCRNRPHFHLAYLARAKPLGCSQSPAGGQRSRQDHLFRSQLQPRRLA